MTTELQPNLNKQLKQLQDEKEKTEGTGDDIEDQIKAVNASINGWKEILGRSCVPFEKVTIQKWLCAHLFFCGKADYDRTNEQGEWHAANWDVWTHCHASR